MFQVIGIVAVVFLVIIIAGVILNKSIKDRLADLKADLTAVKDALAHLKK
jgi:hypothetical protein